jgi:hypothetical protein
MGGDDRVLVLEDLGGAHWPPPWRDGDIDCVLSVRAEAVDLFAPRDARWPMSHLRPVGTRWQIPTLGKRSRVAREDS